MVKRIKKPPVKPEQRLDWLKRNTENGESPPHIAKTDGYDVRTIRRALDMAKQEREVKEARSVVLRNAMEQHYQDLRKYAEMLDTQSGGVDNAKPVSDAEFLEAALRQHLPRSPIWIYVTKLPGQQQKTETLSRNIETAIEKALKADHRLTHLIENGLESLIPKMMEALRYQVYSWSRGNEGLSLQNNWYVVSAGDQLVNLVYGTILLLDRIDKQQADRYIPIIRQVLADREISVKESEEFRELEKTMAGITTLRRKLREELAVIRLRRIVPGRCKYCPL